LRSNLICFKDWIKLLNKDIGFYILCLKKGLTLREEEMDNPQFDEGVFLTKVNRFFSLLDKIDTINAVPFYITIKHENMHMDCKMMRQKTLNDKSISYCCIQPDNIDYYARTNHMLVTCIGCEFYNK
jgi:hypothetical protein